MANKFFSFLMPRGEGRGKEGPIPYTKSEAVRDLLALQALTKDGAPMLDGVQQSMRDAFQKVIKGLDSGQLVLDYQPAVPNVVDIPPVAHEHYMQALLYWCSRLKSSLPRVVEAYARLGKSPSVEAMWATLRRIEQEESAAETAMLSTAMADSRPGLLNRLRK